jgi:hypothetical protein
MTKKQRFHLLKRTEKGSLKVPVKHSYGSLKVKLSNGHFMMESLFKEDCREDEKPGWKKVDNLNNSTLYKIAEKGLLSTKKRRCKKTEQEKK